MKTLVTLFISLFTFASAWSQTANAVVFAENGEKFTLLLNGEKKNDSPAVNVKVSGLTGEFYQARIDFEDAKLADFSNNNFAVQKGIEVTYVIKLNKKGEYVLRYAGEAAISGSTAATTPAPSEDVKRFAVADDEAPAPAGNTGNVQMNTNVSGTGINQSVTVTETTTTTTRPAATTTTTTTRPASENAGINMNVGGVNMGVNVNITGMETDMQMDVQETNSTVVTQTTTTRTTTSAPAETRPAPQTAPVREEITVKGCSVAMDKASFERAKTSVADKGFDETRLSTAKQVAKNNCLSTSQIMEIMGTFGFEETKLDFAKYAYDNCTDKGNYYLIGDAFSFSSSMDALNEFLETK
jgi:hypothetical protein